MLTGDILAAAAARFPGKPAIIQGGDRLSYRALDEAANRFAHGLIDARIGRGDRVAILSGNRPEYAVAYFGIARAGAVSAHLSTRYLAGEIAHALRLVEARLVVAEAAYAGTVRGLRDEVPGLADIVVIGDAAGGGETPWRRFVADRPDADPGLPLAVDDPASITFTGGTTGLPKGALLTHRARSHWARVAVNDFGLDETDVNMIAAPLYHAAGGFIWFQPTVMAGGASVFLAHWSAADFIAAVEAHGGTGAFMVPAQIAMLLDDPAFDAGRLRTLRKLVYGAAPCPPPLLDRAERQLPDVEFIQSFGQTETGPLITLYPNDRRRRPDGLGFPSPLIEAAVFAEPGRPAPPGEVGEIAARGDSLMREYVGDPAETANFYRGGDGWGWTGDLAVTDDDGLITLVGRAREMIISGGVNIFPAEIETVLDEHAEVAECAAFGVADQKWGELPAVAVVLKPGAAADAAALAAYCEGRIARHKRPRRIELVEALPRSSAGKIQRAVLRETYG